MDTSNTSPQISKHVESAKNFFPENLGIKHIFQAEFSRLLKSHMKLSQDKNFNHNDEPETPVKQHEGIYKDLNNCEACSVFMLNFNKMREKFNDIITKDVLVNNDTGNVLAAVSCSDQNAVLLGYLEDLLLSAKIRKEKVIDSLTRLLSDVGHVKIMFQSICKNQSHSNLSYAKLKEWKNEVRRHDRYELDEESNVEIPEHDIICID